MAAWRDRHLERRRPGVSGAIVQRITGMKDIRSAHLVETDVVGLESRLIILIGANLIAEVSVVDYENI